MALYWKIPASLLFAAVLFTYLADKLKKPAMSKKVCPTVDAMGKRLDLSMKQRELLSLKIERIDKRNEELFEATRSNEERKKSIEKTIDDCVDVDCVDSILHGIDSGNNTTGDED